MKQKIQLQYSGIPLVDNAWGGLYEGGTYILIGAHKSGKTLLALQFAHESVKQKQVCLYFTTMRPKDLMIQASAIDFDLQSCMNKNQIVVVRVSPPTGLQGIENQDDFLKEYLKDIVTVVEQYQPNKVVFDEITSFVGFSDLDLLKNVFLDTSEKIEDKEITSLYLLAEPVTQAAQNVVDTIASNSTGVIFLNRHNKVTESNQGGEIIITPNIGHAEGQFKTVYYIEPYKGITVREAAQKAPLVSQEVMVTEEEGYKPLSEIEITGENYFYSSYYNLNDFSLIVNNQVALYKSTGKTFTLISFKLHADAEKESLLTTNQLKNAIRLSTDRKDKICTLSNKIIVLITKDEKSLNAMLARVISNLPVTDADYIKKISDYISILSVRVDDSINNADDLFNKLKIDLSQVPG
jgi:KaiC/GvpD/RAD55 family RecA-like ATPase